MKPTISSAYTFNVSAPAETGKSWSIAFCMIYLYLHHIGWNTLHTGWNTLLLLLVKLVVYSETDDILNLSSQEALSMISENLARCEQVFREGHDPIAALDTCITSITKMSCTSMPAFGVGSGQDIATVRG